MATSSVPLGSAPGDPLISRIRAWLPSGVPLPLDSWNARHRIILALLWLHVPAIPVMAVLLGHPLAHGLIEGGTLAFLAQLANWDGASRRLRSVFASTGLIGASAALVHLSNGNTEMHFHFFVVVAVIALYQDWAPFLTTIGYVLLHHGLLGTIYPHSTYGTADAINHPWRWAGIHGAFVLAESIAVATTWRFAESEHVRRLAEEVRADAATARVADLVASSRDAIYACDLDGAISGWNPAAEHLFGYSAKEAIGRQTAFLFPNEKEQAKAESNSPNGLVRLVADPRAYRKHKDGRLVEVAITVSPIHDSSGRVVGTSTIARDFSERREMENQLAFLALHDPLTGLANRRLLTDRLEHALVQRLNAGESVAILFMDLDDFKLINDRHGHANGDILLIAVAERLQRCFRAADTLARLGGDEFVALLASVKVSQVDRVVDRIASKMRIPFEIAGHQIRVVPSIGIALAIPGESIEDLLNRADAAMYEAKRKCKEQAALVSIDRLHPTG